MTSALIIITGIVALGFIVLRLIYIGKKSGELEEENEALTYEVEVIRRAKKIEEDNRNLNRDDVIDGL